MSGTSEDAPAEIVLGVDYGGRRIGLAVSDGLGLTAQPLDTLQVKSLDDAVGQVTEAAREREARLIVVGYPVLLSGRKGELAEQVDRFVAVLAERSGLKVATWDERLSSVEATRILRDTRTGSSRSKRKVPREAIDQLAAVLLLEGYLQRRRAAAADAADKAADKMDKMDEGGRS